MQQLPYRQIHLDFHTSGKIPGVGSAFDKVQFQEMLQRGHVNSVTLFSKCHHGYTYHDTAVGVRHPTLTCDLLPLQIEACHEIRVQTPIYISAGLDEVMIEQHPEWGLKQKGGRVFDPLQPGFKGLCFNTPYLDYLCAQIEEAATRFAGKTPGIFLDIIAARSCWCNWCLAGMVEQGCNPANDADVARYGEEVLQRYYARTTAACRVKDPAIRVFHNSGHIPKGASERFLRWNSHLELESLPTGGWGYDHFPVSAKYAATTGLEFLGMTGKFHTTWGEFGGFKRAAALRYECAAMLAFGAKCSIGDQLHPVGALNEDTYTLIGAAYAEVETKESWCSGAVNIADIAIVSPEALKVGAAGHHGTSFAEEGAARMLLELHRLFDVIDLDADFSPYQVLVLPDEMRLEGAFREKVERYLAGGGRLLLSGASGFAADTDTFAFADWGLTVAGRGSFDPDYLIPTDWAPTAPVRGPFVIYGGAWNISAAEDWEVLAHRAEPYFNRTWDHFCSHQHTPDAPGVVACPGGVVNDRIAYFAHNLFTAYRQYGQPLYRDLVQDALARLLPKPTATAELPTAARLVLTAQAAEQRKILHLLYAVPVKRGAPQSKWNTGEQSVEVIEDLTPLYEVVCAVRAGSESITTVTLEPEGTPLSFSQDEDQIFFVVPKLLCHQMVAIQAQ